METVATTRVRGRRKGSCRPPLKGGPRRSVQESSVSARVRKALAPIFLAPDKAALRGVVREVM